jgi:hypothetical protein
VATIDQKLKTILQWLAGPNQDSKNVAFYPSQMARRPKLPPGYVVDDLPTLPGATRLAVELYDHLTEPVEAENIAARSENDALVKELTAKLTAGWRAASPESTK